MASAQLSLVLCASIRCQLHSRGSTLFEALASAAFRAARHDRPPPRRRRCGDLALSPSRPRLLLAGRRARRHSPAGAKHAARPPGRPSPRSFRRATRPMSSRAASARCSARPIPAAFESCWSTTRAPTRTASWRGTRPKAAGAADRLTVLQRLRPARRLDRKALRDEPGLPACRDASRSRPTTCSSPMPTSPTRRPTRSSGWCAAREARGTVLTSLMVKLRCESLAERLLVPAFVFFFDKLYPFAWVNDPRRRTAAAAGGCMLVRREALAAAGGLDAIRGALIDDCALGAPDEAARPDLARADASGSRASGPIRHFDDIRRMVVRSAYAELRYSPLRLAGTLARHGAHLSRAAASRDLRRRARARARRSRPGSRWRSPSSRCSASIGARRSGGSRCR